MRTILHADEPRRHEWTRVIAFVCLGLTLAAAVLDRRNAILDRIEAPSTRSTQPAPAPAAMVQEMLAHD